MAKDCLFKSNFWERKMFKEIEETARAKKPTHSTHEKEKYKDVINYLFMAINYSM